MTDWLSRLFVKDCDKVDDPAVRTRYGMLAGIVGIVLNVVLCLAKGAIGLASGSVSIVADAVNNLSDASSNVVSLIGFKLASKPADKLHPYGHGRFEYLTALVISVLVTAVGIELARSGFDRILAPESVEFSWVLMVVMLLSVAVKGWMGVFSGTLAHRIGSDALAATAADSRNDAITTLAVLACALVSQLTGLVLDGWAGLAMGLFVLVSGLQLVWGAVIPLLGQAPSPELVAHIRDEILSQPGVLGMHGLMVHDYGPGKQFAAAHVVMAAEEDPLKAHKILDGIERRSLEHDGIMLTLHWDPVVTKNGEAGVFEGAGVPDGLDESAE